MNDGPVVSCPAKLRILLINEPRAYRETIAAVLRIERPQDDIVVGDPADSDIRPGDERPHIVICSTLRERLQARALSWILLYPDGAASSIVSMTGRHLTIGALEFDQLLDVVEETCWLLPRETKIGSIGGR